MDLNTVTEVAHPQTRAQLPHWTTGDAWLAGGTWLFSEPQSHLTRLIDLAGLKWPALTVGDDHLTIAATCTVAELDALPCPPDWVASPLINQCCRAFLASFKIWKTATVGGNLCMSLPAGPMIALTAALDGVCTIWKTDGSEARVSVRRFRHRRPAQRARPRRSPAPDRYSDRGAAAALGVSPDLADAGWALGGAVDRLGGRRRPRIDRDRLDRRPIRLLFPAFPPASELRDAMLQLIPDALYHTDIHGKPAWRKHMTLRLAEEIRAELQGAPS